MAKRIELEWGDLGDLWLDPDNPRHAPGMARRDIITFLVGNESVLPLAKDIAEEGLSPLDVWGAIEDGQGGYVVVEGNRRLCALLLLHDPSLAPAQHRRAFEKLSADFDPDTLPDGLTIPLAIFANKVEADKWIERKHNGAAGGTGIRSWTPTQRTRHFKQTDDQLALALLDYALDHKWITKNNSADVLTTITRFVSNPHVRRKGLGITTGAKTSDFAIEVSRSLFDRRLEKFVTDIIKRENGATSRNNAKEREAYSVEHLESIVEDTPENDTETGTNGGSGTSGGTGGDTSGGGTTDGGSAGGTSGGGNGGTTHPDKRHNLVPASFSPTMKAFRFNRILAELKRMTKDTPMASAMLVRVFMQAVVVEYLEKRKGKMYGKDDKLHRLVHEALKDIEDERKAGRVSLSQPEAAALVVLKNKSAQGDYVYSAGYLGTVAHGLAFPDWPTLTSKWDEIEPILYYLAANAEKKP